MGGMIIDTSVFIRFERGGMSPSFSQWSTYGETFISVITLSELLVGVYRADTPARRDLRRTFIETALESVRVLDFDQATARVHAQLSAQMAIAGTRVGAHDLIVAATGIAHQCSVLTANVREFKQVPGLTVLEF